MPHKAAAEARKDTEMQVLITGSREWSAVQKPLMLEKVREILSWCNNENHEVIVGDAYGVDEFVRRHCETLGLVCRVFGAYGKYRNPDIGGIHAMCDFPSYPSRDLKMAQQCNMCVAVWNKTSRGTKIAYEAARRLGKRVIVRTFEGN